MELVQFFMVLGKSFHSLKERICYVRMLEERMFMRRSCTQTKPKSTLLYKTQARMVCRERYLHFPTPQNNVQLASASIAKWKKLLEHCRFRQSSQNAYGRMH